VVPAGSKLLLLLARVLDQSTPSKTDRSFFLAANTPLLYCLARKVGVADQ